MRRNWVQLILCLTCGISWSGRSDRAPRAEIANAEVDQTHAGPTAKVDSPQPSPSGEFTAGFVVMDQYLFPAIFDSEGERVWADSRAHLQRFGAAVMWQSDVDVLWILSRDLGNQKVSRGPAGWTAEDTVTMPPAIAARA